MECIIESTCPAERIDRNAEHRLDPRAGEYTVGAGAGIGGDELEEGGERVEAIGGYEGAHHVLECEVIVAERVERGGVAEEVEVEVAERGVVAEAGFQEVEEFSRRDGDGGFLEGGFEQGGEVG